MAIDEKTEAQLNSLFVLSLSKHMSVLNRRDRLSHILLAKPVRELGSLEWFDLR